MKKRYVFLLLVAATTLFQSCKDTAIKGKVLDPFGNPIPEVNVQIAGTEFKTTTDSDGEYSIGYVPGNGISVTFNKEGYLNTQFAVNISTETEFPATPAEMLKIPPFNGVHFVDKSDYISINNSPVNKPIENALLAGISTGRTMLVSVDLQNPTLISVKDTFVFIDNISTESRSLKLVKLDASNGRAMILYRYFDLMGYCHPESDKIDDLKDIVIPKTNSISIRKAVLNQGYYAYVDYSNKRDNEAIYNPIYNAFVFKVVSEEEFKENLKEEANKIDCTKHSDFKDFWADFKKATMENNKQVVAQLTMLPFKDNYQDVYKNGENLSASSKIDFIKKYDKIICAETIAAIEKNSYRKYQYDEMIGGDVIKEGEFLLTVQAKNKTRSFDLAFTKKNGIYKLSYLPYYE